MAHYFAHRARKVAWSSPDLEKHDHSIAGIQRVGTDSTLGDGGSSTAPSSIKRVSAADGIDTFVTALEKSGCVIIEDFAALDTLRKAALELESWHGGRKNARSLVQQSPTIRDQFLANGLYQHLCEGFLTIETKRWKHQSLKTEVCHPVLSSVSATRALDNVHEHALARYDAALGMKHIHAEKYKPGRDSMLGLLIPSSEAVEVHAVLGSHLLSNSSSELSNDIIEEELRAGEALVVLGSLYHYLTAPTQYDAKGESPLVYSIWSCTGVYRSEEQIASSIDTQELSTYPRIVQERLR